MRFLLPLTIATTAIVSPLAAQRRPPDSTSSVQTQADDYTRYELLAPGSGKFRILYEVTATADGATQFFNPIRKGSVASDEHVIDRMTGEPLDFDIVGGAVARKAGVRGADSSTDYIRIRLTRPVPKEGEARLLIDKTYFDPKSYYEENGLLIFARPLGIKRNAIVLPAGYDLVSCNVPSQVIETEDGRISISFWNTLPAEAPLVVKARAAGSVAGRGAGSGRVPAEGGRVEAGSVKALEGTAQREVAAQRPQSAAPLPASRFPLPERAHQDREIVYFLQQPETHAFDLYHDYTESRAGVGVYLNVVRAGSSVSRPSARILDTGEELTWEIVQGDAIARAKLDVADVTPQTQVVVFHFPPVKAKGSVRLRMFETYTDSARYRLEGETLVWDRSLGRPANAVVLPAGWSLTNSAIPATVTELPDGRIRLDFINPRPDEIAVYVTARRR